jgi:response regulator RpfG family c-di-GMP phosphodiesterase
VIPEYNDEVGQLAVEFTRMLGRLSIAMEEIRRTARRETETRLEVISREHETLAVLGRATDYRDPETGAHVVRVGLLAELLGGRIGEGAETQALLRHAAPLHDLGKLGIPDSILLKPGPLDEDETRLMRTHTTIGWEILRGNRSKFLLAGAEIARTHHERWDGSGYPEGIAGDEIPLFGRIVGLVDVFDSLVSVRPYKRPWTRDEAFCHVQDGAGTAFEPRLVEAFLTVREQVERIGEAYPD